PPVPGRAEREPRARAAVGAQGRVEHGGPALGADLQAEGTPASEGRVPGRSLADIAAACQAKRADSLEKGPEARPAGRPRHLAPLRGDAPREAKRPRDAVAFDRQLFRVATTSLDQGALRANAAKMLRTMLEQRLVPDGDTQRQLLVSLDGKLPDDLNEAFWSLQEQGCVLSRAVLCSLMVLVVVRKAPLRTLQLYRDLVSASGEHAPDRAACNAALCALAQFGQADEGMACRRATTPSASSSRRARLAGCTRRRRCSSTISRARNPWRGTGPSPRTTSGTLPRRRSPTDPLRAHSQMAPPRTAGAELSSSLAHPLIRRQGFFPHPRPLLHPSSSSHSFSSPATPIPCRSAGACGPASWTSQVASDAGV
ncbi:unnamed protein product, partial [Prorocentrum cordatum]